MIHRFDKIISIKKKQSNLPLENLNRMENTSETSKEIEGDSNTGNNLDTTNKTHEENYADGYLLFSII